MMTCAIGVIVVEPHEERRFLDPLPVGLVWGVGPATEARLASLGIKTIGDLARTAHPILEQVLGTANGTKLFSGGIEIVSSGGLASGATVASGGTVEILDGGTLSGNVANNGTVDFDIAGSANFGGTLTGSGTLELRTLAAAKRP